MIRLIICIVHPVLFFFSRDYKRRLRPARALYCELLMYMCYDLCTGLRNVIQLKAHAPYQLNRLSNFRLMDI